MGYCTRESIIFKTVNCNCLINKQISTNRYHRMHFRG